LGYTNSNYTDENSKEHRQTGSFIWADGSIGQMDDVWFKSDLADTNYLAEVEGTGRHKKTA